MSTIDEPVERWPNAEELDKRFTWHPPKGDQARRYEDIRAMLRMTAADIIDRCPPSRELALALTHLQEAGMWATAAIACRE